MFVSSDAIRRCPSQACRQTEISISSVNFRIILSTWKQRPLRRFQTSNPAAFLIYEYQARTLHRVPDIVDKLADLLTRYAGTPHQNDAPSAAARQTERLHLQSGLGLIR